MSKDTNITFFGWLRDDGTISFDRDEIIGNVRKVVSGFKNSDYFLKNISAQYDKAFGNRPRISNL